MFRIGIVGDLSMQDPARLEAAIAEVCPLVDVVVQVGDMHAAYDVINKYVGKPKPFYVIPGNHDIDYDSKLGLSRRWRYDYDLCRIAGIDNSNDTLAKEDYDILNSIPNDDLPLFLFAHKPLSMIILPDGSENGHIMGEVSQGEHAEKLKEWLAARKNVLLICGHYHGFTWMRANYCDVLVEGRGGAAPEVGYTIIYVHTDGWSLHPLTVTTHYLLGLPAWDPKINDMALAGQTIPTDKLNPSP